MARRDHFLMKTIGLYCDVQSLEWNLLMKQSIRVKHQQLIFFMTIIPYLLLFLHPFALMAFPASRAEIVKENPEINDMKRNQNINSLERRRQNVPSGINDFTDISFDDVFRGKGDNPNIIVEDPLSFERRRRGNLDAVYPKGRGENQMMILIKKCT